jgi:hypothetical protein
MSENELGSAPIQEEYREKMNRLAAFLDQEFNGDARGAARPVGFVLLVFPFGERDGRCNYISNGADRRDMIKLLREQSQSIRQGDDVTRAAQLSTRWRIGTKVPINVYDGDRPVCQCQTVGDAKLIVRAVNALRDSYPPEEQREAGN